MAFQLADNAPLSAFGRGRSIGISLSVVSPREPGRSDAGGTPDRTRSRRSRGDRRRLLAICVLVLPLMSAVACSNGQSDSPRRLSPDSPFCVDLRRKVADEGIRTGSTDFGEKQIARYPDCFPPLVDLDTPTPSASVR